MNKFFILFLILGLDALFLFFETSQLSISYAELTLLNTSFSPLQILEQLSLAIFGKNDFALRLPMIVLHLLSALSLFSLSKKYLKFDRDRLWLVVVFILLPGVLSSSIVVNSAGLVIFSLFLYLNFYDKNIYFRYLLLPLLWLVDPSMEILFMALTLFAIQEKDYRFAIFNALLFISSLFYFGFDAAGLPKGHFLDTLAIYSAIFTPIVFVYLFYILYRRFVTKRIDILWYIASTALVLSLLLSFRQRLHLEEFAPFILAALPLAGQTFYHSYRVRLKEFRGTYRVLFSLSILFLFINATAVMLNQYLYKIIKNPQEHFAYEMHIAKELAQKLRSEKLTCIDANDKKMQARLEFYGVGYCQNQCLSFKSYESSKKVTISYKGTDVFETYVTKVSKNSSK
jgi:hypothetical protein